MYDLIIRGGTIVDGSGAAPYRGDVAIKGDRIVAVGPMNGHISGPARREIDATGKLVTPGWVDIHTHYDGQITWASRMDPSSTLGATTSGRANSACALDGTTSSASTCGQMIGPPAEKA